MGWTGMLTLHAAFEVWDAALPHSALRKVPRWSAGLGVQLAQLDERRLNQRNGVAGLALDHR